jgi:D-tyrosyl-tRNA(Tyr) deacylase
MKAVVQRVTKASVTVDGNAVGLIEQGLLVLLGIADDDDQADLDWLVKKIVQMRIFGDADGKMNHSLLDVKGQMLVISQFTLQASTKKGNRPSYIKAARPEQAIPLYEAFVEAVSQLGILTQTGVFGADMKVELHNDGPVTIVIDSKNKQ